MDIRSAIDHLGLITGKILADDILGMVFSKFLHREIEVRKSPKQTIVNYIQFLVKQRFSKGYILSVFIVIYGYFVYFCTTFVPHLYHICTTRGTRIKMTSAIADTITSFYKDLHRLTLIEPEDCFTKVFTNIQRRKWERQNTPNRNSTSP